MDIEATWLFYRDKWALGQSPAMDAATFKSIIISDQELYLEALKQVESSAHAQKTLNETMANHSTETFLTFLGKGRNLHTWLKLWLDSNGEEAIDRILIDDRHKVRSMKSRTELVGVIVGATVEEFGREWTRTRVRRWWRESRFAEEEKEVLLRCLVGNSVLNGIQINELGPDAVATVQRLVRQEKLNPARIDGVHFSTPPRVQSSQKGNKLARRISGLAQPVAIPLDIRDSCLQSDELPGIDGSGQTRIAPDKAVLKQAIRRLRGIHPRDLEQLSDEFSAFGEHLLQWQPNDDGPPVFSFPLIRFLHLRLLLDSPSLTAGLTTPEEFLVPEVLMYALGHDAVSYIPELRIFRDSEPRWRARWAESAGEAMSVMFLESTVGIDLSTLVRVETSVTGTPDFKACTFTKEPIVFESKGATAWKTHQKQRNKALEQLGKRTTKSESSKASKISWTGDGRAFAVSLFAAQQGDSKSSLLHVEDPSFLFDDLFPESWEENARHEHYRAVLETARLFDAAEGMEQRRPSEGERAEVDYFTIEGTSLSREQSPRFVGTFLPIMDIARRLRHPDMREVKDLRIFVGLQEQVYNVLRLGELPDIRKNTEARFETEGRTPIQLPTWGLLPGREPNLPPRGIYSSLSNGSFLAVELQ